MPTISSSDYVSPIPLSEALEGVQEVDWSLCPDTELPASGASVSSIDIDDRWVFVAIPGLVQHAFASMQPLRQVPPQLLQIAKDPSARDMNPDIPIVIIADPRVVRAQLSRRIFIDIRPGTQNCCRVGTNGRPQRLIFYVRILRSSFNDPNRAGLLRPRVGDPSSIQRKPLRGP